MGTVDREILVKAVKIIRDWHGMEFLIHGDVAGEKRAWEIYYNEAPEMNEIREALEGE